MFSFLSNFLQKKSIECFAPVPLSLCRVTKPYLLERVGIADGTAVILAVPYWTSACEDPDRNLSAYAVSRDYHAFFSALFDELLPLLHKNYSQYRFAGFADHSPIDEIDAAARAGLGVIGKNRLLLTERYSSYIFLGEIITDALLDCNIGEVNACIGCGACLSACPMGGEGCLSALTQKKGSLQPCEEKMISLHGSVWGCDICQAVCPYTKEALRKQTIFSPIPYFNEAPIARLTTETLDAMSDEEFSRRAYAWRGRTPIRRNLVLLEEQNKQKGGSPC